MRRHRIKKKINQKSEKQIQDLFKVFHFSVNVSCEYVSQEIGFGTQKEKENKKYRKEIFISCFKLKFSEFGQNLINKVNFVTEQSQHTNTVW